MILSDDGGGCYGVCVSVCVSVCVCVCVCVLTTYFILISPQVSYNFKNLLSGYRAQLLFYDMAEKSLG